MKNIGLSHRIRPCTGAWVLLLGLAATSFRLAHDSPSRTLMVLVLLLTLLKGQLVVDYFMGLRHVRLLWRVVMSTYLVTVGALIGLAYLIKT